MRREASRTIAAFGLLAGAVLGQAGGFVSPGPLQTVLWALSSLGLVQGCLLVALRELRGGHDVVAGGFVALAVAECLIWTGGTPGQAGYLGAFAAGALFYVPALLSISLPRRLPAVLRAIGVIAAVLWASYSALHLTGSTPLADGGLAIAGYVALTAAVLGWTLWLARGRQEATA